MTQCPSGDRVCSALDAMPGVGSEGVVRAHDAYLYVGVTEHQGPGGRVVPGANGARGRRAGCEEGCLAGGAGRKLPRVEGRGPFPLSGVHVASLSLGLKTTRGFSALTWERRPWNSPGSRSGPGDAVCPAASCQYKVTLLASSLHVWASIMAKLSLPCLVFF